MAIEPYDEFHYKIINDPIYGCIGLSETEVKLLDTRAMQRLRRIRQMGFASYVFPSGEHSRFTHSLGVLCIMGKICKHLYSKYANKKNVTFSINDVRHLRIAALLHDIGHFPFSHLSECVYSYLDSTYISKTLLNTPLQKTSDDTLLSEIGNFTKNTAQDHEHLGKEVIEKDPEISQILQDAGIDSQVITDAIIGNFGANQLYAQLLHSNIDADRLDYLLRDSRQAGVCFGNIELNYIIQQMLIVKDERDLPTLAFNQSCQHALEHFFMGRYFHYTQVVFHKTSMTFEVIAKALICKALQSKGCIYNSYEKIVNFIGNDDFYNFTDDFMWEYLRQFCEKKQSSFIKNLWKCLQNREKAKCIVQYRCILPKEKDKAKDPEDVSNYYKTRKVLAESLNKIAKRVKLQPKNIGYVEGVVYLASIPKHLRMADFEKIGKEEETAKAIRIIDKDKKSYFLGTDNKSLINKMIDFTSNYLIVFSITDIPENKIIKFTEALNDQKH